MFANVCNNNNNNNNNNSMSKSLGIKYQGIKNNNNNNLVYKAPVCQGTSMSLADSSNCAH